MAFYYSVDDLLNLIQAAFLGCVFVSYPFYLIVILRNTSVAHGLYLAEYVASRG